MNKQIRIIILVVRLSLGVLFVYGGIQKFTSKQSKIQIESVEDLPDHIIKIRGFIGGLKQTGYFWPFLGVAEIMCGLFLISQILSLLGAVMLAPITLNIFLFHLFLEPHDITELLLTGSYLLGNLSLIAVDFPKLKPIFLNTIK